MKHSSISQETVYAIWAQREHKIHSIMHDDWPQQKVCREQEIIEGKKTQKITGNNWKQVKTIHVTSSFRDRNEYVRG